MSEETKNPLSIIANADYSIQKANIERQLAIKQIFTSNDASTILKAQQYLQSLQKNNEESKTRSLLLDPQSFSGSGYKLKRQSLSYAILQNMAKVPIIDAIISTRKEQIADFCTPQKDKYSTGFLIRPKTGNNQEAKELTKQQEKEIEILTEFLLNCGDVDREWHGDDFDSFTRKFIQDCFQYDQGTFEIIRDRKGDPREFLATDGASYRISEMYNEEQNPKYKKRLVNGYLPHYVQVYQERIHAEFLPWELCWGVRNPSTNLLANGYGRSELEILIDTVTSLLNSDQYNANYFKVGANPKGILKVQNLSPNKIDELRGQWQATMSGVRNSHKMLIVDAEKMDFISTQQSNKDMEYSKYQEFLIKVGCAVYKIDPAEIGFPLSGNSEGGAMFEGNNEARLLYSKDKGLRPSLRSYQNWLNKYLIGPKSQDRYELVFVGLDQQTLEKENQAAQVAVTNWSTLNEIRRLKGLKDIKGGDIILNPIFFQMMMQQQQQEAEQQAQEQQQQQQNPFDEHDPNQDPFAEFSSEEEGDEEDPFKKALNESLQILFRKDE